MNKIQYLETIKAVDAKLFHLAYHQKRLEKTVGHSGIILQDILHPPASGFFRCRVVYDGEEYSITYHQYKKKSIQTLKLVFDNEIEYCKKYYDRSKIEKLLEKKSFCDDILIVKNSLITDTSIANIAFKYKDEWITPKSPLLEGTTRARLLESGKIREDDISVEDLNHFEQVALMNAMIDFDIIPNENIRDIIC
ncbi:aminotransferase class IV family protein [Sulfurimonas sp. NWX367]|uniref:aminotransferase class IV family protein n=1 Tax=unclassified Sulfurimonas TaxID=2623549 RepID=UPI003204B8CC